MLRGLAKLLPLIIHEIAEVIIEKLRERRERKVEQQKNLENEKS
ncbi:hypothetical protein HNP37_003986 [Flavobacterium nitrogenifigens]|uniref:Uncharacterized protein n=2 Tax=Flavobacterium TaxID=237 RepID=A0A7W7J0C7_9FLAO|nr:hypothetical protein [Flavobacterium nitrogenifigens]MBB6388942.1 hypothetical protein [Flavobacterium notoginsengisoli]